ncbi:hypothetical protein ABPG74_007640 [Tetrahymena malaccensis]
MDYQTRNIIACGRPGVGKSALGNTESRNAITDLNLTQIQLNGYIDIPGQGDHTLDMDQLAQSLSDQLKNFTIHAILYLVSTQDERFTIQELCLIQFIKSFFKERGLNSQDNLWLVTTHCDQKKPNNQFIQGKLGSLKQWGISIPQNNVIQYDYNLFQCNPFIERVLLGPENQGFTLNQDKQCSLNKFYEGCRVVRDVNLDILKNEEGQSEEQIYQEALWNLYQEFEVQLYRQEQISEQISECSMIIEFLEDQGQKQIYHQKLKDLYQEFEEQISRQEDLNYKISENQMIIDILLEERGELEYKERLQNLYQQLEKQLNRQEQLAKQISEHQKVIDNLIEENTIKLLRESQI